MAKMTGLRKGLGALFNAKLVNDDEAVLIAREIADEIADKVQFPGEIKVNVIRETRATQLAKKAGDERWKN